MQQPSGVRLPAWLDVSLRVLQVAAVPVALAVVGYWYSGQATEAQLKVAREESTAQLRLSLIDKASQHLKDEDPAVCMAFLDMLEEVHEGSAAQIRASVGEPVDLTLKPGQPAPQVQVSPAVREAIRAQPGVEALPIAQSAAQRAQPAAWYVVLSSDRNRDAALGKVDAATRTFAGTREQASVYHSRNGYYALTLGGALTDGDKAKGYAAQARRQGYPTAYAWQAPGWQRVSAQSSRAP